MASAGQNYRLFVVYHLTSLKALDGLAVVGLFTFFSLINICLSLSDEANKIKSLNIEKVEQFQSSLKF